MDNTSHSIQDVPDNEPASILHRLHPPWIYHTLRCLIAALFLWSGATKISDPNGFALIIDAYGVIPESWLMPVAIGLPVLELLAGIGLLGEVTGSLTLVTGLLILFMAVLAYGIALGLDVDCGCFGPDDPEAAAFHGLRTALYRDFLMMAGIVYLYAWRFKRAAKPARLVNLL